MDKLFRIGAPIVVVTAIVVYGFNKWHSRHPTATPFSGGKSSLLSGNDKAMVDKLAPFIHCLNNTDSKLMDAARAYREMVVALKANPNTNDPDAGFDFDMGGGFKPHERDDEFVLSCASELEKISGTSPKVADLDTIGPDYAATLRKLTPLMNQADLYYQQNDYKDDHMARGNQLDAQLSPLLDHLRELSHGMRAGVARENNILRKHELDAIEARDGKNLEWHTMNFMIQSRVTYNKMKELAADGKLDAASMDQAIQPVQAAFDGATAYAAAHASEIQKASNEENEPLWKSIENSASRYLTSLKDLRRELQGNSTAYSINSQMKYVQNCFNSVIETYNVYRQGD
jgi:hypothetical protein